MIAWFVRNPVAANLLMICILISGMYTLFNRIPLEVFPTIDAEVVNVSVTLRGATPEDIELGVAVIVEEAVQDLEGIKKITSVSSEGSASISMEIDADYDPRDLLADIKSRVDAINTFPAGIEQPVISLAQRTRDVISVTVASDYGEKEIYEFAQHVQDDLLTIPGVTQLQLAGVRDYEIAFEVSQDKLRQYDVTLADVSSAVANSSTDISAGNIRTDGGDVLIRSTGQAYHKDQFVDIPIRTNEDGSVLRLKDVATVLDGFEETPVRARFNGKSAAFIDVYRVGQQSAIDVADEVKNYIEEQQPLLPKGFYLSYWDDNSEVVKSRIATLTGNAIQGGVLVLLLLTLFLRPAIAFWVFIGIPVSFMGAFLALPIFDVTLNVLSLFGFILVLGIVVDDAIVTGENIYTHLRNSDSSEDAVIKGTQEVAVPVTFGVLTTIAAFMPLAFIEGNRGALFGQIPIVVIPVLLFSLIESKFVLPSHLKHLKLNDDSKKNKLQRMQIAFADGFEASILRYYKPLLNVCLNYKATTLILFTGAFIIILTMIQSGWTRFTFFPRIPSETVRATLVMPAGTPFEVTNDYIVKMSNKANEIKEKHIDPDTGESIVLNILASTGGRGGTSNVGSVRFEITPPESRASTTTSAELVREWRKLIGPVPGVESLTFRAEIGRSSDPIDVQLSGNSQKTLQEIANKVKAHLTTYPTVFDIADSLSDGKEELQIDLTEQGKAIGLTRADVTNQVRSAFFGTQVQRIQRGRDDVRVMVRLPLNERRSVANLNEIQIRIPSGGSVPLSHVAILTPDTSPSEIRRIDRYRTINITADVNKESANMTALQASLNQYVSDLVSQYPGIRYEFDGEAREQRESFSSLKIGLAMVLFAIYCLLAIPLKSYIQPAIVMSIIPFSLIGAVIGHWIMGMPLTIMSFLGMLALIGVVVNDSLVLVDFINQKRKAGMAVMDAILTAGAARFRPIMLTSLTTFIGLMPLLFEKSTQAQFLIPMAVSLGFGIIFATLITLILVPINYLLMYKGQNFLHNVFTGRSSQH